MSILFAAVRHALGSRCVCGHGRTAHEHYRDGTDCSLCPCGIYQRKGLLR